jgi:hypothetical protein
MFQQTDTIRAALLPHATLSISFALAAFGASTCRAEQPISMAIVTVERADAASEACDAKALDGLLYSNLKMSVSIKDSKTGKYDLITPTRSDVLAAALKCRNLGTKVTIDRTIKKAEVAEDGRIDVSGTFLQQDVYVRENKSISAKGNFLTSVWCDKQQCTIQIDISMINEVLEQAIRPD